MALQVVAQALQQAGTLAPEHRVLQKIGMVAEVVFQEELRSRVLLAAAAASTWAAESQDYARPWLQLAEELAQVVGGLMESFFLDRIFLVPLEEAVTTLEEKNVT